MIWGGQKSFVDSRTGLFYGNDEKNLLALHNKTRVALREDRDKDSLWKAVFNKYQIRQACPRLNGPVPPPDYITFLDLLASKDFQLTDLNMSTAVFTYRDPTDETTKAFLKDHSLDLVEMAFRTKPDQIADEAREFSKPATTYDNLFSLRCPNVPGEIQAGQHYLQLAVSGSKSDAMVSASLLLAIRHTNQGLIADPNCPDGYRVLGMAYSVLGRLESGIISKRGPAVPNKLRYYQCVAAFQQAAPRGCSQTHLRSDQAVAASSTSRSDESTSNSNCCRKLRTVPTGRTVPCRIRNWSPEEARKDHEALDDAIHRMEDSVGRMDKMVTDFLSNGSDRLQVANGASQAGGLLKAISVLEEDAIYLAKNPSAKLTLAGWLIEAGRGREAAELLDAFEGMGSNNAPNEWRDLGAISSLTVGNYAQAIKLWNDQTRKADESQLPAVMTTLPFVTLNPNWIGPDAYPTANIASTAQAIQAVRVDGSALHFQTALAQMESGAIDDAVQSLQAAVEAYPTSHLRPLWRFYLDCLTGEMIDLKATSPEIEEIDDVAEPAGPPETKPVESTQGSKDAQPETKTKAEPD